jgi:hypothetical protein
MLALDDPSGPVPPPSMRRDPTCEEKIDKSQELEISTTLALGVSRSIRSKSCVGPDPCGTYVGYIHCLSLAKIISYPSTSLFLHAHTSGHRGTLAT